MSLLMKNLMRRFMAEENDDGSNNGGGESGVGTGNDARVAMLEAINDQNDQGRADEFTEIDDDGQVTNFIPNKVEKELPTGDEQDEEATARELQRMEDEANGGVQPPAKVKIKVNGKEMELSQEELIERAQKVEAADTYLAEAARLRKEATERARETQSQPVASKEEQEAERLEKRRALVRAIQMGTEEEAMAAVEELQRPAPPAFTADELNRTVDERLTFNEAVSKFKSNFSDVVSDPVLLQLVLDKEQVLLKQGDSRGYYERYSALGKEIREWRDGLVKTVAPADDQKSVVDKQARKSSTPAAPKPANVKVKPKVEEDDQDESPAAVIANMAQARGGPQWMRN